MSTSLVSGTGGPLILEVSLYAGGPLVDLLSLPTITITSLSDGGVVVGPTTTGVLHPATGTYVYNWSAPVSGGLYLAVWDGEAVTGSPMQASEIVTVYAPSSSTVGPCDGWDPDTSCCPDWDTYTPELQASAINYATFVLWAATGRRFGLCTKTVRPCTGQFCNQDGVYGFYWNEGTWFPYILNGLWRNWTCGCGCSVNCQVYLPGPVNSIISVLVDGEVVDPDTYRVDNAQWLVRTHTTAEAESGAETNCWPRFQDFNKDSPETDTFVVSYLRGLAVPPVLQRAAGELACEWAKACLGLPCRLPGRVTSISRQGVSVSMVNVTELLQNGLTGVDTVDQIIMAINPYGMKSAMRVVSPDQEVMRETTWP